MVTHFCDGVARGRPSTIQKGINSATKGDTVYVADGRHFSVYVIIGESKVIVFNKWNFK